MKTQNPSPSILRAGLDTESLSENVPAFLGWDRRDVEVLSLKDQQTKEPRPLFSQDRSDGQARSIRLGASRFQGS